MCNDFFKTIQLIAIKFRPQIKDLKEIFEVSRNMGLESLKPGNKQSNGLNRDLCNGMHEDF